MRAATRFCPFSKRNMQKKWKREGGRGRRPPSSSARACARRPAYVHLPSAGRGAGAWHALPSSGARSPQSGAHGVPASQVAGPAPGGGRPLRPRTAATLLHKNCRKRLYALSPGQALPRAGGHTEPWPAPTVHLGCCGCPQAGPRGTASTCGIGVEFEGAGSEEGQGRGHSRAQQLANLACGPRAWLLHAHPCTPQSRAGTSPALDSQAQQFA